MALVFNELERRRAILGLNIIASCSCCAGTATR